MRQRNTIEMIIYYIGRFVKSFIKFLDDATTPIYHSPVSEKNQRKIKKQKRNKLLNQIKKGK